MVDLSTAYLGLKLRTPLVPSACPLTQEIDTIRHLEDGEWRDGPGSAWNSFMFFDDPDGNSWAVQERPAVSGEGG